MKTHGETGGAEVLEERIAAVNAADILKTKDIRDMSDDGLRAVLKNCKSGWGFFGPDIHVKLVDHRLFKLMEKLQFEGLARDWKTERCYMYICIHIQIYIYMDTLCFQQPPNPSTLQVFKLRDPESNKI